MDDNDISKEFLTKAHSLALKLDRWERECSLLIIGHRDGDGVSAISVLYQSLKALGFNDIDIEVFLSPDIEKLRQKLTEKKYTYVITGDIGSIFEEVLNELVKDYVIADHHPSKSGLYGDHQLNPCEFGMNDEVDCSGSTTALIIFLYIFPENFWYSDIGKIILCYALSGAISDFQLQGMTISPINKYILDLSVYVGAIDFKKDICIFGRGIYSPSTALNRSGITYFQDNEICKRISSNLFEFGGYEEITRIIDLSSKQKISFLESISSYLSSIGISTDEIKSILDEIVGYVYDLKGLKGWACTVLVGNRTTLDAREILHRVNYVCRRGKSDLAIKLLNNKEIDDELWEVIEGYHRKGDKEVAESLNKYENGQIQKDSWDDKIVLVDFTDLIFYDEVGVIAGVIMKKYRDIEIMLSCCEVPDDGGTVKISIRARSDIWDFVEQETGKLSDAKEVYNTMKQKYPDKVMQYGGHRWACSGYIKKEVLSNFFSEMISYYKKLS